jgi:hypothetical protein
MLWRNSLKAKLTAFIERQILRPRVSGAGAAFCEKMLAAMRSMLKCGISNSKEAIG